MFNKRICVHNILDYLAWNTAVMQVVYILQSIEKKAMQGRVKNHHGIVEKLVL